MPVLLVPGVLREDELAEQTGFRLPDGPYETLAGFVMSQLGHIPVEGERVEFNGWSFVVTSVERHRIEQVKVRPSAEYLEDRRAQAAEAAARAAEADSVVSEGTGAAGGGAATAAAERAETTSPAVVSPMASAKEAVGSRGKAQ